AKENRLTQAEFACTACGHATHADVNAAVNILRAGLALRRAAGAAQREAAFFRERRSHVQFTPFPARWPVPHVPWRPVHGWRGRPPRRTSRSWPGRRP
ncbi:zinc ribbon domain-containing protein, partial [Nonomuraea maritima]|uniref:zinc ribbon domain-containing protein n=1 Tax=Nonomuraea maritima TaxID=683260 RepID=UPI003713E830